jgi:hypothetical protein
VNIIHTQGSSRGKQRYTLLTYKEKRERRRKRKKEDGILLLYRE